VLARALDLARTLREQARAKDLPAPSAVGIGAGGQIDPDAGVVVAATDVLPGWAGTPLRAAFEDALSLPCAVDNDVNALASGETRFGAGRGLRNLVFLALGTGVGGALLVDGKLVHGARGAGGELGHLVLVPDGHPCTCGGRGCLEQYASGPALLRHFRALGGEANLPHGAPLAALARQDPHGPAARAVTLTGDLLGLGLVSLANVFGPDRFIVGGGLAALGDLLLDPARQVLRQRALPGVRDAPVVAAALGPDASVIGAATLAMTSGRQENAPVPAN
jgi:glucokinase